MFNEQEITNFRSMNSFHPILRGTLLLVNLIGLASTTVLAQHENDNWLFGRYKSLRFISDTVLLSTNNSIYAGECSTSISDSSGNLLFYSTGETIWDVNNDTMPNGTGLTAVGDVQQGVLAVPVPNTSIYYVFTIGFNYQNAYDKDIHYSIVDMSLNNGLGEVTEKNIFLDTDVTEKLAGTQHANKQDYWVVYHAHRTDEFKAYLIDEDGLSSSPVISHVGLIPSSFSYGFTGSIKFSPNSEWLSCSNRGGEGTLELFHFDNETGVVTGGQHVEVSSIYGMEFSSDNSKLYVGSAGGIQALKPIYQFDLSLGDDSLILASPVPVSDPVNSWEFHLAPDCRIYFRGPNDDQLGVIHYPNFQGTNCEVDPYYYSIGWGSGTGLPNQVKFNNGNGQTCYGPSEVAEVKRNSEVMVYPNPTNSYVNLESEAFLDQVWLMDMAGRRLMPLNYNGTTWQADLTQFSSGMYLLSITSSEGQRTVKLVKE